LLWYQLPIGEFILGYIAVVTRDQGMFTIPVSVYRELNVRITPNTLDFRKSSSTNKYLYFRLNGTNSRQYLKNIKIIDDIKWQVLDIGKTSALLAIDGKLPQSFLLEEQDSIDIEIQMSDGESRNFVVPILKKEIGESNN
jgi:hypothetical protein